MTIISTTVGKNPLEKNGVAIIANKRVQNAVLGGKLKNERNDLCSLPKQTIQYHSYPSLCPNHWCQRSWSLMVLWWPTRPSRMNIKKDALFSIQDWNAKEGSQEVPGVTGKFRLWIQNEEGQILTEFFQENTLVIANPFFQQHKTRLYTWTPPVGQNQNQIDYVLCSQRWRSSIQSAKIRLGADCGSDHELLIAKFILNLRKVGETTRSFRYDINQIPYNYTVEVTNRFKGLDLIECLKNYGQRFETLYRRQWSKPSPRKRNAKGKMVVWGGVTNSCENKRSEKQRRKGKIHPFECRVPKNSKERKERLAQWSKKGNTGKQ